ncbi:hypothetical protein GWI33_009007, partial [Rhynchophorus ferrugineus]
MPQNGGKSEPADERDGGARNSSPENTN